jgi:hypothetical protein
MAYGTINTDLMTTSDGVSSSGLYGFKNRIINGAMVIDQRNAGAAVTASTYCPDRWRVENSSDAAFSAQQVSDAPTGFVNSLKWTTTTADASLAATQYALVRQGIEGYNIADLMWGTASAATITISFWVKSTLTGTFGGVAGNGAFDRSYPFTYTISSANTWEYKTITIAGDTTGTWATTNAAGMQLYFGLGAGTTYSGTAGAWTLNATWQITGVQLEKGSTATSFDYRPYGQELMLCQRYFLPMQCVNWCGYRPTASTGALQVPFVYPILRAAPTFTQLSGTVNGSNVTFDVGQAQSNYLRLYHNITYAAGTVAEASLSFTLSAEL